MPNENILFGMPNARESDKAVTRTKTYAECLFCGDKYFMKARWKIPDTIQLYIYDNDNNIKCAALYCMDCFVHIAGDEFVNNMVRNYNSYAR